VNVCVCVCVSAWRTGWMDARLVRQAWLIFSILFTLLVVAISHTSSCLLEN
jgi:hypothetical protein